MTSSETQQPMRASHLPGCTPAGDAEASPRGWGGTHYLCLGLATLLLFAGGLGSWSVTTEIAGAVVAVGTLEVESKRQVVQHAEGGVVEAIMARDGDRVEADDVLIRLDGGRLRTDLAIVEGQHLEMLARKDRLKAEQLSREAIAFGDELRQRAEREPAIQALLEAEKEQFELRRAAVQEQSEALRVRQLQIGRQTEGLKGQSEAIGREVEIMASIVERHEAMVERHIGTEPDLEDAQREFAKLEGVRAEVAASLAENEARIAEIEISILRLASELREKAAAELRELEFREIELRERRRALGVDIAELELRAPASGVIYGSVVDTLKSVIRPAEPAMYVVPEDAPLIVRARVETNRISDVQIRQSAVLRFPALNARTTPEVSGTVVEVSADAIQDERTGMSFYVAEIRLSDEAKKELAGLKLLPGMPSEAFISTTPRSPISYLFKPLSDYVAKALRER
jgi:HlyD family secretion protein